ncbi:PAS domain S-box-containing protein/diguanylate cyclase (GGDEF) domain-containing protein [Ferrimonas sediminum]|uniref:cyclic-guanylate-specific phosphodiesterase n=1 Tax=Ferrimonas sediminum TaxID=718193 RepID=A0A1G8NL43_9GAMM|nr:EAL domain-containing protein [Ferrimonas sediminum]SDI80924.1 PAS domain S-box-containing protein/diguanylate cyclase (GGDEF) domain-containing protein [Ferrimonas sediminum]
MDYQQVELSKVHHTAKQWLPSLQILERSLGAHALIAYLDHDDALQPLVASASLSAEEQRQLLHEVTARRITETSFASNAEPATADLTPQRMIELFLPTQALFGVLCLCSGDDSPLPEEALILADNLAARIQRDLALLQQDCLNEFNRQQGQLQSESLPSLQAFINSIEGHIWIKNLDGIYVCANHNVSRDWGTSPIGKNDLQLFGAERSAIFDAADRNAIRSGKPIVTEECADADDPDQNRWLETIKSPVISETGEVVGVIGMTRNISQRKAFQDQLSLAATVFANSVEGVLITDRHGTIIEVNNAFTEITGYRREEAISLNPRILKSGRYDNGFYETMWQSLTQEGQWQGELWNRRKDGSLYPQMTTLSAVYDDHRRIRYYVAVFADISEQKQAEERLAHMAYHDPLTGLPNRAKMQAELKLAIERAEERQQQMAVVFVDVDHFKLINDSAGHLVGDEVLCEVANRLKQQVRQVDTVARIGGDEFVVLLSGIPDSQAATAVVSKLMALFERPFELGSGDQLRLTSSLGIALFPQDGRNSDTLLKHADSAMYRAKQQGRNSFSFFTQSQNERSLEHLKLQSDLHDAIANHELHLNYQPQYDLASNRIVGIEALIRWHHPRLGVLGPARFINMAERMGLITDIGLVVLTQACHQASQWLSQGLEFGRIAVNVAGPQLLRRDFSDEVQAVLKQTGCPASALELEVTENFLIQNPDDAIRNLNQLRALGIHIAIDDFGTGYSSLSYLKRLPLTTLKIDQSFVHGISVDADNQVIAKAIISMGNSLSLNVIAEGVETREQAQFLAENGCEQAQGFLFSRPVNDSAILKLLTQQTDPQPLLQP